MNSSYSSVADEYYDAARHPTSSDFGHASYVLLRKNVSLLKYIDSVCEIGAGRSSLLRVLDEEGISISHLHVTDKSPQMLSYSARLYSSRAKFAVCDATELPFENSRLDLVVSLLGDPYNSPALWREVNRVLKPGGRVFYTTPSWEWAVKFRHQVSDEKHGAALFQTTTGQQVFVPSTVLPEIDQSLLMAQAGIEVVKVCQFRLVDLRSQRGRVSPKISEYLEDHDPIVTAFVGQKVS